MVLFVSLALTTEEKRVEPFLLHATIRGDGRSRGNTSISAQLRSLSEDGGAAHPRA